MPDASESTIRRFYDAFDRLDGEGMEACYAPDVHFNDPVFGDLHGPEAGAMWRMLTGNATDLEVELASHSAQGNGGSANWTATYTFRTGRRVVNHVDATFTFGADGLITEHVDRFSLWRWSRQALGPVGLIGGWTPIVQGGIRKQAREQLDAFIAADGGGAA